MRLEYLETPHEIQRGRRTVECFYVVIGPERKMDYFETRGEAVGFINAAVNATAPVHHK